MRAEPEEILSHHPKRSKLPIVELLLALAVIVGLVIFWFWTDEKKPEETVAQLPQAVVPAKAPSLPPTPDIPVREEVTAASDTEVIDVDVETAVQDDAEEKTPLTAAEGERILQQQFAAAGAEACSFFLLAERARPAAPMVAPATNLRRSMSLLAFLGRVCVSVWCADYRNRHAAPEIGVFPPRPRICWLGHSYCPN